MGLVSSGSSLILHVLDVMLSNANLPSSIILFQPASHTKSQKLLILFIRKSISHVDARKRGIWGSHGSNGPTWGLGETQGVRTSVRGLRGLLGIMRVWEELEEVVRVIWPRKLQRGQEGA